MKLSQLFDCENPVPFLKWYKSIQQKGLPALEMLLYVDAVHQFLSQPFTKDMVIRPEMIDSSGNGYHGSIKNWQPVFLGEWRESRAIKGEIEFNLIDSWDIVLTYDGQSLDSFLGGDWMYNVKPEFNPEYEIRG